MQVVVLLDVIVVVVVRRVVVVVAVEVVVVDVIDFRFPGYSMVYIRTCALPSSPASCESVQEKRGVATLSLMMLSDGKEMLVVHFGL